MEFRAREILEGRSGDGNAAALGRADQRNLIDQHRGITQALNTHRSRLQAERPVDGVIGQLECGRPRQAAARVSTVRAHGKNQESQDQPADDTHEFSLLQDSAGRAGLVNVTYRIRHVSDLRLRPL
jgi:hypothetical protein